MISHNNSIDQTRDKPGTFFIPVLLFRAGHASRSVFNITLRATYMNMSNEERNRILKNKHQQLYRDWKRKKGLCIICGEAEGNEKDHLPPKVLFPESLRNPKTEFFTFPVCSNCNGASSDEDFLFSVILSLELNQKSILNDQWPTDPDLLALYNQTHGHLEDPEKTLHRQKLLRNYIGKDPNTGRDAINIKKLPINQTLTKIVKSIYWLHTGGDILETYNPGWWIIPKIDTSKTHFIEKHLKMTSADIYWGDRFISHFSIGHPENGVGGFILCSLHFYTKKEVGKGKGMSWYLRASPVKTTVKDVSLYELCVSVWGAATIGPRK